MKTTPKKAIRAPTRPGDAALDKPSTEIKSPSKALNLREAIALKRAEAKKAADSAKGTPLADSEWNEGRGAQEEDQEEDILGREGLLETIEKSKQNGERVSTFKQSKA